MSAYCITVTVGVAEDILQASLECIIDGLEWKLRGELKH
jgi:hypothetical protein